MKPHKCPVCDGTGLVSRPPYIAGDINEWVSGTSAMTWTCCACSGTGIVWEPDESEPTQEADHDIC
jgi:hypothetical protein